MFDRAKTLRRLGLACLIVTLGCKPEPATINPDEPKPDAGGPPTAATGTSGGASDGGADVEPADGPSVPDGGDADVDTDDPEDPDAAGAGDPEPTTTVADAGDTPEKPGTANADAEPLPKPIHQLKGKTCQASFNVGSKIKGFKLPNVDGTKDISPANYRKRVMLLNFWGTWCKPCLKELPEFDQLYRRYRKHGMTLLAIATDEEPEGVVDFADKRKLAAKLAIGGETYAGKYGSPKFPFTFVVDYKGIIRAAYRGYKPECMGQLEADIREQLEIRAEAKAKKGTKE